MYEIIKLNKTHNILNSLIVHPLMKQENLSIEDITESELKILVE